MCSSPQIAARAPLLLLPSVYNCIQIQFFPTGAPRAGPNRTGGLCGGWSGGLGVDSRGQGRETLWIRLVLGRHWKELWLAALSCLSSLRLFPCLSHFPHYTVCCFLPAAWTRDPAFDTMDPSVTYLWLLLACGLHLHTERGESEDRKGETQGELSQHQLSRGLFLAPS